MQTNTPTKIRLVKEQRESQETVPQFCAARGLKEKQFYVWRQRYGNKSEARFTRIGEDKRVELELRSGVRLFVGVADLKAVLGALA